MSLIPNSCESSIEEEASRHPVTTSLDHQSTSRADDGQINHQPVKYTGDYNPVYHIAPSSASSASSSAISAYTLPPHMQYYHSHHYMTEIYSPTSVIDNQLSHTGDQTNDLSVPEASYSALSEKLRKSTPNEFQCSLFCGGRRCKYESGRKWKDDEKALPGIYSHWVTEDILAMSRPNTDCIVKHNLVDAFKSENIKSIINLQEPGEHAHCGNGLHSSGFSYDPQAFMRENIYFYNFKWRDYTPCDVNSLLNMVKVMAFALTEGRVAIHCHAGLGRTGVLICCFLIFTYRCKAREAISFVRSKRPYSVQMKSQIENVYAFYQFFLPLVAIFPTPQVNSNQKQNQNRYALSRQVNFTLQLVIKRQQMLLHGYESRHLKFIPKILYFVCEKLLQLCNKHRTPTCGLKWQYVTSLSHAVDELLYSRSREASSCTSSSSSISSFNSTFNSPLTSIVDFQIVNSSEAFTRHFLSSVPLSLLDNNLIDSHVNYSRISSMTSSESSSKVNNKSASISQSITSSSACSSHNSFKATEPVIREEVDEEETPHFINIISEESEVHRSAVSSSDSLNNYTGDSPPCQSPSGGGGGVDFTFSPDGDNCNHAQQIHSNLLSSPSVTNCSQSMPPVEDDLILTPANQQVSKLLSAVRRSPPPHVKVNTDSNVNNKENIDSSEYISTGSPLTVGKSAAICENNCEEVSPSPSDLLSTFLENTLPLVNPAAPPDDDDVDDECVMMNGDHSRDDQAYEKVKSLLENVSTYVDSRELECGDVIEEESPSFKSISSHVTSGQEYNEIIREYEKESVVGMVESNYVIDCLLKDHTDASKECKRAINAYEKQLNEQADSWDTLSREINIEILCGLFWSWLEGLSEPVLNKKSLIYVVLKAERPLEGLAKLDKETRYTLEYLLRFMARLQGDEYEGKQLLRKKLLATLTHQSIKLNRVTSPQVADAADADLSESVNNVANVIPANRTWPEMRRGTNGRVDLFLKNLYSLIQCYKF